METTVEKKSLTPAKISELTGRLRAYLPEVVVTILLVVAFAVSSLASPFFLDAEFLFKETLLYMEMGILAIALTPLLISGNLDLSVASAMVMIGGLSAYAHAELGLPMVLSLLLAMVLGVLAGGLNGLLVAYLRLPWLTVTLGTLALYRGIAQILLGVHSIQDFPEWFIGIDKITIPGTQIPAPFVIFLLLALIFGLMLHKSVLGRWIYALGTNEQAAHFSGIPIQRIKLLLFVLTGLMAAIAGVMITSRLAVARYDHARGMELDAITAVVLGGTSIFGGRGTIYGTVVAIFLVGVLRTGMGVANVKVESQLAVIGSLLVVSVIVSNLLRRFGR
jgi:rhamnose transport system permease protein